VLALAILRVGKPCRRSRLFSCGPLVAHVGPEPARLGLPTALQGNGVSAARRDGTLCVWLSASFSVLIVACYFGKPYLNVMVEPSFRPIA
jgi:hypothetical protein